MKPRIIILSLLPGLAVLLSSLSGDGLKPVVPRSEIFAQGVISTPDYGELNSAFLKDGREFYFTRRGMPGKKPQIMVSIFNGNGWGLPESVSFSGTWSDIDIFIPPGDRSLLFCSTRPHKAGEEEKADHDFWITDRTVDGWSEPRLFAPEAVSASEDFFPVVTAGGNLYFNSQRGGQGTNDIYCSEFRDGHYTPAVKLPEPVNTPFREFDAFVTQDEKMIVFSSERPGGFGGADLYATWKDQDGKWSEPVNLGSRINSAGSEYGSAFSPDGNTFFFTSNQKGSEDIFSIPAGVFEDLQKNIPGAPRAICTITYLGNEGFLCETGTRKILVDALFGGISGNWCEQPGDSLTDLMIRGKEPFGEIDLVLVTHCHADHFNAPMTIAFLQNHGESILVCPAQAAEKLKRADGYSAISGRIVPVNSFAHPDTTFTMKGVSIRAMRFRHGSWMESDPATGKQRDVHEGVENLGYLFEPDGCSVLHTGDGSSTDKAGFALHNLSEREVDVVFLDRTFLSRQGYGIVCENMFSRNFILMHIEPGKKQYYHSILGDDSGFFFFKTLMQEKTITR